tara:strand:+ start:1604 stop:1822 length:219 start_codon:yes stop_codon:yes gene_type:complete
MNYIIRLEAIGKQGRERVMEALEEKCASDTIAPMVYIQEGRNGQVMTDDEHCVHLKLKLCSCMLKYGECIKL